MRGAPLARRRTSQIRELDVTRQTKVISAALLVGALVPGLAGCWGGPAASTQVQATQNTGNGTQAFVGDIRVENATLILGPEGSSSATLTMSIVAPGEGDRLLARVTRRSWDLLALATGQQVFAQVKSVALAPTRFE